MLASPSEVAAGNAKLVELRAQVDALGVGIGQLDAMLGVEGKRVQISESNTSAALKKLFGRHRQLHPKPTGAIVRPTPLAPKVAPSGHRPRYRFQTKNEKDKLADIEMKVDEIDQELAAQADAIVEQARTSNDAQLVALAAELDKLALEQSTATEALQGKILLLGFNFEASVRGISDYRAQLMGQKATLEGKKTEVVTAAEAKYKEDLPDHLKVDRQLKYLVDDIKDSPNWMLDSSPGISARDYMNRIDKAQQAKNKEYTSAENIFVYSENQGRVVHCQRKKNLAGPGFKWDFARYYTQCFIHEAAAEFAKCQGRDIDAPPAVSGGTDWVPTLI
jgi:hypothetical protein